MVLTVNKLRAIFKKLEFFGALLAVTGKVFLMRFSNICDDTNIGFDHCLQLFHFARFGNAGFNDRNIVLWFDLSRALFVASLMPLTWGDAFAAILGRRFGRTRFVVFNQTRSVEGSLAMFAFSLVSTFLALVVFGQPAGTGIVLALAVALVATVVEALSPWGIDNLTVPLASALVLVVLSPVLGK